jgi:uncharacterized protein (TIGR02246 family)
MPSSQQTAGNEAPRRDMAAIEEKVAELEKAQQQESVEDFVGLLAPKAVWVTGGGRRLTGRDEIRAFTEKVLPGAMKDSTARYEVVHISFVRPDVAVANVRQRPVTHDGEPLDGQPEGRPVYVMAENEGRWEIVAAQNTIFIEED